MSSYITAERVSQEYGGQAPRSRPAGVATDSVTGDEENMQSDHIESGWREFLDRLKRFWGKLGGDAPTPALG